MSDSFIEVLSYCIVGDIELTMQLNDEYTKVRPNDNKQWEWLVVIWS